MSCKYVNIRLSIFFFILLTISSALSTREEEEIVETWASNLGDELWRLGLTVTKEQEIKTSYKKLNARVLPTDGEGILKTILDNINNFVKQKMDAVRCIIKEAEENLESFDLENNSTNDANTTYDYSYHSGKFSNIHYDNDFLNVTPIYDGEYKEMNLTQNPNFYNIYVNTDYSSVQVPTDIYDLDEDVQKSIAWSEMLNDVFKNNYNADDTISWQYFCSSHGYLRQYPAMRWGDGWEADDFDCRSKFWFTEATTCSKDIVMLVDSSGSMYKRRNMIAQLTIQNILDTFSNNDFFNIFTFNTSVRATVPCFENDTLVQATPENINIFKKFINYMFPDDKADYELAFKFGFDLLKKRREIDCNETICNQAIMMITDNVPEKNLTDVFLKYNRLENGTITPIRIIVYVIGKEVTNVDDMKYVACLNNGYYGHIKSLEEVRAKVVEYVPILARPLILQKDEHPLSWTTSFLDEFGEHDEIDNTTTEIRAMTTVSGPIFSYNDNVTESQAEKFMKSQFNIVTNKNNETKMASLVGVAGVDVLIKHIQQLTLPYKIGANGYPFMLTNTGHLLFHPNLRYEYNGTRLDNFNSIDFTEVEHFDDDVDEPRVPHPEILQLREDMLTLNEGKQLELEMKFHYDDMRRVGVEARNYYYSLVNDTSFTVGFALPYNYGSYWIKAGDEIKKSMQMGIPLISYFRGNWRLHPHWVYCDYRRTNKNFFSSQEKKVYHFLEEIFSNVDWEWKEKFSESYYNNSQNNFLDCEKMGIEEDDYYCDKELMQLLVFDAKVTDNFYKSSEWAATSPLEEDLVESFNASVRFVATQSGLTRWQYIRDVQEEEAFFEGENFSSLEESWYKSAVLHYHSDPEAFVFSVPFNNTGKDASDILVTATHAIFPRDGGHEAPGCVVGLQISYNNLYKQFMSLSKSTCVDCLRGCASNETDCYIIDNNGYIVISENITNTGKFFGEIEGDIMKSLVDQNIFRSITVFEYQATCLVTDNDGSNSGAISYLRMPFKALMDIFTSLFWLLFQFVPSVYSDPIIQDDYDDDDDYDESLWKKIKKEQIKVTDVKVPPQQPPPIFNKTKEVELEFKPCDLEANLFLLQDFSNERYQYDDPFTSQNTTRSFYFKKIKHTNLVLIVIKSLQMRQKRHLSSEIQEVLRSRYIYNELLEKLDDDYVGCHKINISSYSRRPLPGCFNSHELEEELLFCSSGSQSNKSTDILVVGIIFYFIYNLRSVFIL